MLCGFLHVCFAQHQYHAVYRVRHRGRERPQVYDSAHHRDHAVSQERHRDYTGPQVHNLAVPENPH